MSPQMIKKRSGDIVEFQPEKITIAVEKAYIATDHSITSEELRALTLRVVEALDSVFASRLPGVEEVQDVVERKIAERGDFKVARSYILYREERKRLREAEREDVLAKADRSEIMVIDREGNRVPFRTQEIERMIQNLLIGYEHEGANTVSVAKVVESVKLNVYDGISIPEINKAIVLTLKQHVEDHPVYAKLSARMLFNDLYKEVFDANEFEKDFTEAYTSNFESSVRHMIEDKRLDARLGEIFDFAKLSAAMKPERDRLFDYMGAQVLYDRYFVKDSNQRICEAPQYFWMRVGMGLALGEKDPTSVAIDFYNLISEMNYVPSTPTLLHSGTSHAQMSSCYLNYVEDDLHHIFKVIGDNAQLSKYSGGIGTDWTNIRATNSMVKTINIRSQGLIPFLKIVDSTTASINRSGKRRGATAVYLENWHLDFPEFLDLRKNTGDDRRRTHDVNTAAWISDLFMKRVQQDETWTLFSPEEVPDLHQIYGKKFEEAYENYEKKAAAGEIRLFQTVKARDLWRKHLTMLFETGHPWVTFKDPSNIRSPQDHVGVVHASNLCTEITLNTSAEETAVCNLGSVSLAHHVTADGKIDREKIASTVKIAMRMLDNVIDLNFYPTKEAETSNLRHRPVGLGVMGFQDMLYKMNLPFDSDEAVQLSDEMMEAVSYYAILGSSELAKEKGTYESYKGSKWDRNLLPIDTMKMLEQERGLETGVPATAKMDWNIVRDHIKQHGMRNSNTLAIAPTATIANISGQLPSIEPIYKNLYVKSNFSGEFTVLNEYLVLDLQKLGLWDRSMLDRLKYHDGSVQYINNVPVWIKDKYKEAFEMDAMWIIKHAARRQKWMDQSQSVNIFTRTQSGRYLSDIYMTAWEMGLKTTYYLRTMGASSIEKSTLDINKKYEDQPTVSNIMVETEKVTVSKTKLHVYKDDTCESCQ